MLEAIVFDFDGVIVDSEPFHFRAFARVAQSLGITFDYDYYMDHLIGYDDRDVCRILLAGADGASQEARLQSFEGDEANVIGMKDRKAEVFEQIVREGVRPIDGALPLIEEASKQMPLAIASGATRADIDLILDALELQGRFDPIVTADDVRRSKPDSETYVKAVSRLSGLHSDLNLLPGHCLAIEDTAAGLESARGAGLWTLGLATTGSADRLSSAHRVIDSLEEVSIDILQQWFG